MGVMPQNQVEWTHAFRNRAIQDRVPLSGSLELTSRCNLKCVHCYLGPQEDQWKKREQEMSTTKVLSVIDEIVESGCLYLLITGGDPMVHRDFAQIYRYACEKGLLVTVFCDGILVNEAILALFDEYPPQVVEISIYGATAPVYEAITRVKGSYPRAIRGIERLLDAGISVGLKTVMMEPNKHEVVAMAELARAYDVSFRVDSAIFPCLPVSDDSPTALRLSPQEAVAIEFAAAPERLEKWVEFIDDRRGADYGKAVYRCGAGLTSFHLDPFGHAQPCLMTTQYRHSLEENSFESLWRNELVQLRSLQPRAGFECNSCEMQLACSTCPGFNYQENGAEDVKSQYVCETTNERWRAIQLHRSRNTRSETSETVRT